MPPPSAPLVILLNGASSSGKTTIAQLLQVMLPFACLHAGIDHFFAMLPPGFIAFEPAQQESSRDRLAWLRAAGASPGLRDAAAREQADKWRADMRRTVAAIAALGNHMIVDDIITRAEWATEYRQLLGGNRMLWVGIRCPLAVLEEREAARTGRVAGQAREHFAAVHAHCSYDLEVDSGALSPYECALAIRDRAVALYRSG